MATCSVNKNRHYYLPQNLAFQSNAYETHIEICVVDYSLRGWDEA